MDEKPDMLELKEQTAKMIQSIARTVQVVAIVAILFVVIQFVIQLHLLG